MIMPAGAGEAPLIHDSIISSAGAFTHLPFLFIYGNLRNVCQPLDRILHDHAFVCIDIYRFAIHL